MNRSPFPLQLEAQKAKIKGWDKKINSISNNTNDRGKRKEIIHTGKKDPKL